MRLILEWLWFLHHYRSTFYPHSKSAALSSECLPKLHPTYLIWMMRFLAQEKELSHYLINKPMAPPQTIASWHSTNWCALLTWNTNNQGCNVNRMFMSMINSSLPEKGYETSIWGAMSHNTQKMDIVKSVFIHIFILPHIFIGSGRVGGNVDVSLLAISNLQVEHPNKTGEILFFETQLQTPKVQQLMRAQIAWQNCPLYCHIKSQRTATLFT